MLEREIAVSAFRDLGMGDYQFALDHIEELIVAATDLVPLEAAIRKLAVTGRLSETRDIDKPIGELLDTIAADVLDPATKSAIDEDGWPHVIPTTWRWVELGAVLLDVEAGWSPAAQGRPKVGDEWGVLKVSACSWGAFRPGENKALVPGQAAREHLEVQENDFLISRANTAELVARSVIAISPPPRLMLSDKTLRLSVAPGVNKAYLNLANGSATSRAHYERLATGTSSSMKNVSQKIIRRTPIPLPPPDEQDRIVAVVDELMAVTNRLRTTLAA